MHRMFVAVALLSTAAALLHSHRQTTVRHESKKKEKYAYVTMKFVHGKTMGSQWAERMVNTMNNQQLKEEAHRLFDPERAEFEYKKARAFKKIENIQELSNELDGTLPCEQRNPLKQVTRLAGQLSGVNATYPLVVYTNDECLVKMKEDLPKNVILETNFKYLPRHCAMNAKNNMHFHKLGVFDLTQYSKLMWMDWDLQLKANIDDLFQMDTNNGKTVYGQRDDWKCTGKQNVSKIWESASGGFCSGLMLFEPKQGIVDDLIANQGKTCWGDQVVISRTFAKVDSHGRDTGNGREWKVWDQDVISFRGCQRKFKPRVIHHAELPGNDPGPAWRFNQMGYDTSDDA